MPSHPTAILLYSMLVLSFSVLTFTLATTANNALAGVSKSRAGDSDSVCNSSDKACRIDIEYSTNRSANLQAFARWTQFIPAMNGEVFL